jgi:16S rRNA A1518/A1519 N6-dimethyltransferase RsmA/KsgA/DIM1 with predicted DNA glycosylase/AP lyase activity
LKPFAAETDTDSAAILMRVGIDPNRRPETLELREFAALSNAFSGPQSPAKAQQREEG